MTEASQAALDHVRKVSIAARTQALHRLSNVLSRPIDAGFVAATASALRASCRLTLNFHPDRLAQARESVADGLLHTGLYLPQSETGLSNGGRTAIPGGDRFRFEAALFGHVYDQHVQPGGPARRPCYGALDFTGDPFGASPRFGSSFIVLHPHCFDWTTFCVGDSHQGPGDVGTIDSFASILAGLLEAAANGDELGRALTPDRILATLMSGDFASAPARNLDGYIESQIHDTISLTDDVITIVLDPSFRDSETYVSLQAASDRYDFALEWHCGSVLPAAAVPADFRGPTMPELARQIVGENGTLTAAEIGRAATAIPFSPLSLTGDTPESALQQHKYLWHCVLKFGTSAS